MHSFISGIHLEHFLCADLWGGGDSVGEEQVWADRKSVVDLCEESGDIVPGLVTVGSERVWLETEVWLISIWWQLSGRVGRVTKGTACHESWEMVEARPQRLQQRAGHRSGMGDHSARAPVARRNGPGLGSLHGARGRRQDLCFGSLGVGVCGKDGPSDEEAVITAEVLDIKEGGQSDWHPLFFLASR